MADQRIYPKDSIEFARAVTFFDAIFAFAVTLLITTVDDFSPAAWSSLSALREANGPALVAFAISFVVVVSFWRGNHSAVAELAALNSRVILLNCVVMFGVVLIPFATEALGKLDLPLPVAVYAVVISGTALVHRVMEDQAELAGLSRTTRTPGHRRWDWIQSLVMPVVFLGSIPLAYLASPTAAQLSWLSLLILEPLVGRLGTRAAADSDQGGDGARGSMGR